MKGKFLLLLASALTLATAATVLSSCSTTNSDPTNYPNPGAPPAAVFDNNGTQVSGF